jgi:hypothetical protein
LKREDILIHLSPRYNFQTGPKNILSFVGKPQKNFGSLYLTEEPRTNTEAQLVATWTSRKFLTSLLPKFENTRVKLAKTNEVVPIFAVLHKEVAWKVVQKSTIFPNGEDKKQKKKKSVANGTPVVAGPPPGNSGLQHENTGYVRLFIQGDITVNGRPAIVSKIAGATTMFELDKH